MEWDFRKAPSILNDIVDVMVPGVFTVDQAADFVAWSASAARLHSNPRPSISKAVHTYSSSVHNSFLGPDVERALGMRGDVRIWVVRQFA